jgi:hypothetical protein
MDAGHGSPARTRASEKRARAEAHQKNTTDDGRWDWKRNPSVTRVLGEQVRKRAAANTER